MHVYRFEFPKFGHGLEFVADTFIKAMDDCLLFLNQCNIGDAGDIRIFEDGRVIAG